MSHEPQNLIKIIQLNRFWLSIYQEIADNLEEFVTILAIDVDNYRLAALAMQMERA